MDPRLMTIPPSAGEAWRWAVSVAFALVEPPLFLQGLRLHFGNAMSAPREVFRLGRSHPGTEQTQETLVNKDGGNRSLYSSYTGWSAQQATLWGKDFALFV